MKMEVIKNLLSKGELVSQVNENLHFMERDVFNVFLGIHHEV